MQPCLKYVNYALSPDDLFVGFGDDADVNGCQNSVVLLVFVCFLIDLKSRCICVGSRVL